MDHKTFMDNVSKTAGIDAAVCSELLEQFVEFLEDSLCSNDSVSIPAFGTFESRKRNERIMSHPSEPGKRLLIPPKVVVSFKPSAILKAKLNDNE